MAYRIPDLPSDCEAAVRKAIASDLPGRAIGGFKVCDSKPSYLVVRVYLPHPNLHPTPYLIYKVDVPSLKAHRLDGEEAAPYLIPNYK